MKPKNIRIRKRISETAWIPLETVGDCLDAYVKECFPENPDVTIAPLKVQHPQCMPKITIENLRDGDRPYLIRLWEHSDLKPELYLSSWVPGQSITLSLDIAKWIVVRACMGEADADIWRITSIDSDAIVMYQETTWTE